MLTPDDNILQIIPAAGWIAVCTDDAGNIVKETPVACWALLETPMDRMIRLVIGMDLTGEDGSLGHKSFDDDDTFTEYVHESQIEAYRNAPRQIPDRALPGGVRP